MTDEQQQRAREAIKARMDEVGMTRYALGKSLGWDSTSTAYMILSGTRAMTWQHAVDIAGALWPRRDIARRALRAIFDGRAAPTPD